MTSLVAGDFPPIPLIDVGPWMMSAISGTEISPEHQKIVDEIQRACQTVGFFTIENHGIDQSVIDEAWRANAEFFDSPLEEKIAENDEEYPYGYEQKEQLSKGKALDGSAAADDGTPVIELKETLSMGPNDERSGMPTRRWAPTKVSQFQTALETCYEHMEGLSLRLLELFALALGRPIHFFRDKMDRHMSALRLIHYYPQNTTDELPQRIIRAGAHTDYGALTILNAAQPGLQVLRYDSEDRGHSEWYSVPLVPGALLINLGDLMQRWTNDEWVSTLHRVVMSTSNTENDDEAKRRYSMAFFVNINGDTMIHSLTEGTEKYPPILARDHLMAKHLASMGIESKHEEL